MNRTHLFIIVKITASTLLIWWVLQRIDLGSVTAGFGQVAAGSWIILYLLQLIMVSLLALRLRVLGRVPLGFSCATTLKAQFFQLAGPSQLGGDAYRAWALVHHRHFSKSNAVLLVFADRLVGIISLVVYGMGLLLLAGLGERFSAVGTGHGVPPIVYPVLLIGLSAITILGWRLRNHARVAALVDEAQRALKQATPGQLGLVGLLSLCMYLMTTVMAIIIMFQLPEANFFAALTVPPLILLATLAFPLSINGIGVREVAGVVLYGGYGFDTATSVLLVTAPFLVSLAVSAAGFLWWLTVRPGVIDEDT